ncbi:hypothetical protein BDY21DRAFT_274092, partial [Lineolata rhizophorae]
TVGKSVAGEKIISVASAPAKAAAPRKVILLNAYDQRIDAPLAKPDRASVERLNGRIKEHGKVCNEYHLTGKCSNSWCGYVHGERMGPGEQLALRHKARGRSCTAGSDCRAFDC